MTKCDCCDIDLAGAPLVVHGKPYCCLGCSEGGPCVCSYEKEDGRRQRNGHPDPVVSELLYLEGRDGFGPAPRTPSSN